MKGTVIVILIVWMVMFVELITVLPPFLQIMTVVHLQAQLLQLPPPPQAQKHQVSEKIILLFLLLTF